MNNFIWPSGGYVWRRLRRRLLEGTLFHPEAAMYAPVPSRMNGD